MKKTLFLLAAALCGTASAALQQGDILAVTFTGTSAPSSNTFDGTVLGQSGTVNAVQVDNASSSNAPSNAGNLLTLGGESAGISLALSNAAGCGTGGMIQTYQDSVSGALSSVFGISVVSGTPNGGCINGTSVSLTLTGLTAGETYNFYALVGRGNNFPNTTTAETGYTYALSGGVTDVTSTLIGASSSSTSISDNKLTSYEYNATGNTSASAWALVEYTFTATSDTLTFGSDGTNGNINAFALQQVTPEPTTATLSLLALAGLCARRRRK